MSPGKLRRGHLRVTFSIKTKRTSFQVHHLVLLEFVGPRPTGLHGLHNNDIPDDNCFKNLRWGSQADNMRDAVDNGRMPNNHPIAVKRGAVMNISNSASVMGESIRLGIPWRTIYDWLHEANVRRPKPTDNKLAILEEVQEGSMVKDAATKYGVSQRAIYRWLKAKRANGGV